MKMVAAKGEAKVVAVMRSGFRKKVGDRRRPAQKRQLAEAWALRPGWVVGGPSLDSAAGEHSGSAAQRKA